MILIVSDLMLVLLLLLLLMMLMLMLMCSTQQQPKVLWMEDSNSTEVAQLAANNRASDASSTDCGTRQVTGNCCTRGGSPSPVEFSNRVPLHTLSGERIRETLQIHPIPPLQTSSRIRLEFHHVRNPRGFGNLLLSSWLSF